MNKQCDKCKVQKQCPLNEPIDNDDETSLCSAVANLAYAAGHFDGVLAGSKIGQADGLAVEKYMKVGEVKLSGN